VRKVGHCLDLGCRHVRVVVSGDPARVDAVLDANAAALQLRATVGTSPRAN